MKVCRTSVAGPRTSVGITAFGSGNNRGPIGTRVFSLNLSRFGVSHGFPAKTVG